MTAPQCCGLCHQGRRPCVTPEACHVPASTPPSDGIDALASVGQWAAILTAAVALVSVLLLVGAA